MTNFNSCLIVVNNILRELDDNFPKYLSQGLGKLSEILPSIIPTIKNSNNIDWNNHKKKIDITDKETNLNVQILIQPTYKELKEAIIYLTDSENIKEKYIVYVGSHGAGYSSNWLLEDGIFSAHTMLTTLSETSWVEKYHKESASPINILTPKNSAHWNKILSTLKIKETKQDTVRVFSFSSEIPIGEESIFHQEIDDFSKILYENFESILVNNAILNCSQNIGTLQLTNKNGSFYIFDEGCGQSSLLALSGFNLLIDSGYKRTPEFWNFLQKLEKIDTLMMTSWNEFNLFGMESLLKFQLFSTENKDEPIQPNLNYCLLPIGPNPVKEKEKLDIKSYFEINIEMESHKILRQIKALDIPLLQMSRDAKLNPHQLYFKLGQGCLDAFPLWPCSPETSGYSKRYIEEWEKESKCQPIYFDELVKDNASAFLLIWNGSKVTTESTNEDSNLLTRILITSSCHESHVLKSLEEFSKINPVCNTLSGKASEKKIPEKKSNPVEKKSPVPLSDKVSVTKKSAPVIDRKELNKDIPNKSAEKKPLSAKGKVLDKKDEKKNESVIQTVSDEKVKQNIEKKAGPKTQTVTNATKKPSNDKVDVAELKKPIKKSLPSEKSSNLTEVNKIAKKTVEKISDKKLEENKINKKCLPNDKVVETSDTKKPLKKSIEISDSKKPSKKSLGIEKNGEIQEIKKTIKKSLPNEKPNEIHDAKKDIKKLPHVDKSSEAEPRKAAKTPLSDDKSSEHGSNKFTKKTVSSEKAPVSDLKKTAKPVKDEVVDHKKVPKRLTSDKVSDKPISNKKAVVTKSDIEAKKCKDVKAPLKTIKKSDLVHDEKNKIKVGDATINKKDLESDLEKIEIVCQPSISLNTDDTLNNIDTSELLGKIEAIGSNSNHIEDEQLLITGEKYDLQSTPLSDMITDSPEHPKTEEDVEALKTDALSIDQDLLMTNEEFPEDDKVTHFLNDDILECNKIDNSVVEIKEFSVNENLKQYGIYEDGEFEDEHYSGYLDDSHEMHDENSETEKDRINLGNAADNVDEINESHQDKLLSLGNEEFAPENINISEDSIKESENEVIQHSIGDGDENIHEYLHDDSNLLVENTNLEQFEHPNTCTEENEKDFLKSHNEKDEDESKKEIHNEIIQDKIMENKEILEIEKNLIDNENMIYSVQEIEMFNFKNYRDEQETEKQNDQIDMHEDILENSVDLEKDEFVESEIETQLLEKVSGEYFEDNLNKDLDDNAISNSNLELIESQVKESTFDENEIEKDDFGIEIDLENIELQAKYINEYSNEKIENKNNLQFDVQENDASIRDIENRDYDSENGKVDNPNFEEGIPPFNIAEIDFGNEKEMQEKIMEEYSNEEIENTTNMEDDVHETEIENNYSDNDHENIDNEIPSELKLKEFEYDIEIEHDKNEIEIQEKKMEEYSNEEIENTTNMEDDVHETEIENNYSDNDHQNLDNEIPSELKLKEFEYPIEIEHDNIKIDINDDGEDYGELENDSINNDNFIGNLSEKDKIENDYSNEDNIHKDYVEKIELENEIELLDENTMKNNKHVTNVNNEYAENSELEIHDRESEKYDYSKDNKYFNEDHNENFETEKELEKSNKDCKDNFVDHCTEYEHKLEDKKAIHDENLLEDHPIKEIEIEAYNFENKHNKSFENTFESIRNVNFNEENMTTEYNNDFEDENNDKSRYDLFDKLQVDENTLTGKFKINDSEKEAEFDQENVEHLKLNLQDEENDDKVIEDVKSNFEMEEVTPVENFEKENYSDNEDNENNGDKMVEDIESKIEMEEVTPVENFEKENYSENEDNENNEDKDVESKMEMEEVTPVENFEKENYSDNEDNENNGDKMVEDIESKIEMEEVTPVENFEKENYSENEDNENNEDKDVESKIEMEEVTPVENFEKENYSENEDNENNEDKDVESKIEMEEVTPVENFEKENYSDNEDNENNGDKMVEDIESKIEMEEVTPVENFEKENYSENEDNENDEDKDIESKIEMEEVTSVENFEKENFSENEDNENNEDKDIESKVEMEEVTPVENFEKENYSENEDNENNEDKDIESKVEMEEVTPVENFEKENYSENEDNENNEDKDVESKIEIEELTPVENFEKENYSENEDNDDKVVEDTESEVEMEELKPVENFEKDNYNYENEDNKIDSLEITDYSINRNQINCDKSEHTGESEGIEINNVFVKSEIEHEQTDESNFNQNPFNNYDKIKDCDELKHITQDDGNPQNFFENNEIDSIDVINPSDSKNDSDIENNEDENDGEMIIHDVDNSEEMDYIKECDENDETHENKNASEDGDSENNEEKFECDNLQSNDIINQDEIEQNQVNENEKVFDKGDQVTADELENIVKSHNQEENFESKYDETEVDVSDKNENNNSHLDTDVVDINVIERPNSLVVDNFQNMEDLLNVQADSASSENHLETDRIMPDSESNDSDLSVDIVKDHTSDTAKDSEQNTFTQPTSGLDDIIEDYSPGSPSLHENAELQMEDLETTVHESPVEKDADVGEELDNTHYDKEFDSTNVNITPDILRGLKHLNLPEPAEVEVEQVIEDEEIIKYQTSNILDSGDMFPLEKTETCGISDSDSIASGESIHALSQTENIDDEYIDKSYKLDNDNLIGSVNGNHHYEQFPESNSTSTSHWNEPLGLPMPTLLNSKPTTKPPVEKNSSQLTSAKLKSTQTIPPKVNGTQSNNVSALTHKATDSPKNASSPRHNVPPKPSAPKSTGISKTTPSKPAKKTEIIDQSKLPAFYLDVAYIPVDQDGNVTLNRVSEAFFTRIRARQYILPGFEHNFEVLETFLASRKKWAESDNEMEVRLIPIKMTETLKKWAREHAQELSTLNIKIGAAVEHCSVSLGGDNTIPSVAHRIDF